MYKINFLFTDLSLCDKIKNKQKEEVSMQKIIAINCSRDNRTRFNPEHKKERHKTLFPENKKRPSRWGKQMVSNLWMNKK